MNTRDSSSSSRGALAPPRLDNAAKDNAWLNLSAFLSPDAVQFLNDISAATRKHQWDFVMMCLQKDRLVRSCVFLPKNTPEE